TYQESEIQEILKKNPYSFLQIIHPFFKKNTFNTLEEKFENVKKQYESFKDTNIFFRESQPIFYLYKKETENGNFIGLIAATSTKDYKKNIIKKHEKTLKKREILFKNYLKKTGFNAEPVLLTYPDNPTIEKIINAYKVKKPEYQFQTQTGKNHSLWLIDDINDIQNIKNEFKKIESLYIADGHHRSASSYLLSKDLNTKESNYFLSYLIPESNLKIASFNRLVNTLNNLSESDFLQKLSKKFDIIKMEEAILEPNESHQFSMYLGNNTYLLKLKSTAYNFKTSLHELDTHILYKNILKKILGIENVRTDKRLAYISQFKGQQYLKDKVVSGEFKVAFGLFPATIEQMKKISDEGLIMPPKSTYILPKLKSGLIIYEF
ncbi:MAG TPA: DUF1015 domain-containing protein, partial [Flavobacteriia bacterium]|nr:DUF1015 domain-containing protein [Flavobacteriia bacterium]